MLLQNYSDISNVVLGAWQNWRPKKKEEIEKFLWDLADRLVREPDNRLYMLENHVTEIVCATEEGDHFLNLEAYKRAIFNLLKRAATKIFEE